MKNAKPVNDNITMTCDVPDYLIDYCKSWLKNCRHRKQHTKTDECRTLCPITKERCKDKTENNEAKIIVKIHYSKINPPDTMPLKVFEELADTMNAEYRTDEERKTAYNNASPGIRDVLYLEEKQPET